MKADELWEKYGNEILYDPREEECHKAFMNALKEYGEYVKAEAASLQNKRSTERHGYDKYDDAAAIEKMPLP